ncbi:FAD-dependent oxidoreductase [uncultured Methylobacterium sp.]|uniref:GcvT family protein n=1 Tax=uncultured Methylobacterium sp. TaxID=157278 RepID=UPI0025982000|nr:FAD-dependent oxidoreductase [uncultured Methylobacterium sp.]
MSDQAQVVIIGGGAVGASCLYHLAKLGCTDTILIEMNELTSGSTWHAAGNCPTYSSSLGILKLQKYSADLYDRLGAEVDYPMNYHKVGAIRLAHTEGRMDEFRHVQAMARANGIAFEILKPEAIRERHPFIELDDLKGALWDPYDGDIDPSQLTQALAKGARDLGAKIRRFTKVTSLVQTPGGEWIVGTDKGEIRAGVVVNAGGYRAGEIMALLGRPLPIVTMSHQYLVTEDIPELLERTERLPLMRDPDVSYYLRQERGGFILGPYEWQATPMWLDGLPEDFAFKLWNDDLDRLETYIEAAMGRVPPLATAGVRRVVNGPIPYSPDGNPYIGPERGLKNFYHANTFSFGIAQAGGAGKALAEWVVEGRPEWDLWSLDRRRYTAYADQGFTTAKAVEVYQNEYAPAYPNEEREAGRPLRMSPLYERLKGKGARFGVRGGWERAVYFRHGDADLEHTLSFRREKSWLPNVAEEVAAVRETVGVIDMPGFAKFEVSGPGADAHLSRLVCSPLPALGRIGLAYALTKDGRILSELTVTRLAADRFYVIAAAAAEWHDDDLLARDLPADGSVTITRLTEVLGTIVVAGPRARDVLSRITEADLSNAAFPWLTVQEITACGVSLRAMRITYVGELGWELHAPIASLPALYDAVMAAGEAYGIRDVGMYAVDSLRLDKCYRGWKSDLEIGFTPLEASLDVFIDFEKPDFVGREALLAERARGPRLRFVPLTLDESGDADAPHCAPVFHEGRAVGIVTSGGWSETLGKSIALSYVETALATPGTTLSITILGEARTATVGQEPLLDPQNLRPQA